MTMEQKIFKRWYVVIGAILIQLALGSLYSWGTMTQFISNGAYLLETTEVTIYIFGIALAAFAITMIFAGRLQQKYGPMKITILGAIFIGTGTFLSAAMTSFIGLFITYGILFGMGIGFAYVCPIATAAKWYPEKKGFISGIAVAGFGAGSFLFNYLIRAFALINIPIMFILLGIIYLAFLLIGAITMRNPPEGWVPVGYVQPPPKKDTASGIIEFERGEMVRTKQFWLLWLAYILGCMPGLLVIGTYSSFAKSNPTFNIFPIASIPEVFVFVGSIAALFNGLGRILWGKIADIFTYKRAMLMMFTLQAIALFLYFTTNIDFIYYLVLTCVILLCFGGNLSLFPTGTADLFGNRHLGENYGVVFTAYGIAGFVQAVATNQLVLAFGGYLQLYLVVGFFTVGAALLIYLLKPPKK
ncbi:MAG: MFS transporter [Promethearchaeota archaeon]|nr:MAG: MFS transporter [Candidatus Lokiarchaeota archaeon]